MTHEHKDPDPEYCKASVADPGGWRNRHQCSRKAKVDGWCKQHHPDAVKARRDKADVKWRQEQKARDRKWHCQAACRGIVNVKALPALIEAVDSLLSFPTARLLGGPALTTNADEVSRRVQEVRSARLALDTKELDQ